jgi:hypothetical protein
VLRGAVVLLNRIGLDAPDDLVGECTPRLLWVLPVEGLRRGWWRL